MKDLLQLPFIQVALPIIVMFMATALYESKRIDDLRESLNRVEGAIL